MSILINILAIIFLVVVVICVWKTVEQFNRLPEFSGCKGILAWDALVLIIVAVYIIIKLSIH